jgi:hypothetical protein
MSLCGRIHVALVLNFCCKCISICVAFVVVFELCKLNFIVAQDDSGNSSVTLQVS